MRLNEAEEALYAIRNGEVDAIVVSGKEGDHVFSLTSAETPYRKILEEMEEGAVTINTEGLIHYCNKRFANIISEPIDRIVSAKIEDLILESDKYKFRQLIKNGSKEIGDSVIRFLNTRLNNPVQLKLSVKTLSEGTTGDICIILSDVSLMMKHIEKLEFTVYQKNIDLKKANEKLKKDLLEIERTKDNLQLIDTKLTSIFDSMSEGLALHEIIYDQSGKAVDYIISDANRAFEKITGLKRKAIIGKRASKAYKVEVAPYLDIYSEVASTGKPVMFETYFPPMKKHFYVSVFSPGNGKFGTTFQDITERKLTEEALSKNEKLLRSVLDNANSGVALIDESGRFQIYNPLFLKLFGISENASVKNVNDQNWADWKVYNQDGTLLDVDDHPVRKAVITGKHIDQQLVGVRLPSGGDIIWMLISAEPLFKVNGDLDKIICTYHDVTEQRKVEEKVRESEERYHNLFSAMPSGVIAYEVMNDGDDPYGKDFIFKDINPAGEKIDQVHRADIIGKSLYDFFPNVKEMGLVEVFKRVWQTGVAEYFPVKHYSDNKIDLWVTNYVWRSASGELIALFEDITEHKQREEALRINEQKLKYHFENSPLAVIEWDRNFNVIQWSAEAEKIFGFPKAEVLGKPFDSLNMIFEDDIELVTEAIREMSEGSRLRVTNSNRNYTKNRDVLNCIWYNSVLLDGNDKMSSVLSLVQDVTKLKNTEDELIVSKESYQELVTNARSIIVKVDSDGRFLYINPFGLDFFGFKEEELLGKSVIGTIVELQESTGRDLNKMVENILDDPDKFSVNINENIKKNGEKVWVEWHNKAAFDSFGNRTGHTSIGIDVTARRKAEENLAFHSLLLSEVNDAVFSSDSNFMINYWNNAAEKMFGWTKEEALGKNSGDLLKPKVEGSSRDKERLKLREAGQWNGEVQYIRKNGTYISTEVNSTVLRDTNFNDKGNLVVARDITERQQVQEELKKSEQLYRAIGESIDYGIWVCDANGKNIYASESYLNLVGITQEQCSEFGWGDTLHPDDVEKTISAWKECVRTGGNWSIEHRFRGVDGEWHPILARGIPIRDEKGNITMWAGINLDISSLKTAEQALLKSQERFRLALKNAPIGVSIQDKNLVYQWAYNQRSRSPEEIIGKTDADLFAAEDLVWLTPLKKKILETGKEENVEKWLTSNGKRFFLKIHYEPILNVNGEIIGIGGATIDLTDRKLTEDKLKESEAWLSASISSMATGIILYGKDTKAVHMNETAKKLLPEELFFSSTIDERTRTIKWVTEAGKPFPPEDIPVKRAFKGETTNNIILCASFNDRNLWISANAAPILSADGEILGVVTSFLDITDNKNAEIALRMSEERLRVTLASIGDAVMSFDTLGRVAFLNPVAAMLTGWNQEDAKGLPVEKVFKIVNELTQVPAEDIVSRVLSEGKVIALANHTALISKNGTQIPIEDSAAPILDRKGKINGVVLVFHDVTQKRLAQEALRKSEERFRTAFEKGAIPMGITSVDTKFIEVNPALCSMLGYSESELIGHSYIEFTHPDDISENLEKTKPLYSDGQLFRMEKRYVRKDGTIVWTDINSAAVTDLNGKPLYVITHMQDITMRKQAEDLLHKSEERYRQMFDKHHAIGLLIEPETGAIIDANSAALKYYGYTYEQICSLKISDINQLPPDEVEAEQQKAIAEQRNHFIFPHRLANGEERLVEVYSSPLYTNERQLLYSIIHDITERKRVEEALKESEETLWSVLNATQESIYMFDKEGMITMSNRVGLERKQSADQNELLGHHFSEFLPANVAKIRQTKLNEVFKTGKPVEFEDERDGRIYHHNFFPVFKDNSVSYVVNYSTDITDRKRAADKLRESEERLRVIAESLPVMISIFRISDSTFSFVNEYHEIAFGYKKGSLLNKRVPDIFYSSEDRESLSRILRESGKVTNKEYKVKRKDDSSFWIMTSIQSTIYGNEPSYLVASIDITETKRTQEQLLQLNRTLNAHSKSSKVMMHAKNEIDYLNQVCNIINHDCGHRMVWIGYAQNDRKKSVKPIVHCGFDMGYIETLNISWADNARGRGPTGTAIRTGKPSMCKNILTDPAFEPWREAAIKRGFASSLVLPFAIDGKPYGAVSIYSRDPDPFSDSEIELLSELVNDLAYGISFLRLEESERAAIKAIRENEAKLKELIATKDKFFNIVAHDLKNPFTSMLGSSELLYEHIDGMSTENIKKLALILNDSAKGGYSILLNLLDWSRSQTGQLKITPQKINLKDLINENISNLQLPATVKEISINYESSDESILSADKNMLHTILRNLISNALKYTHKKGKVVIGTIIKPDYITVFIKDNGVGIPKDRIDKLFKLDVRNSMPGTENEQGTGLGLKLCKEFVEMHGGSINVESVEGKGSTFSFTIPVNHANN